MGEIRDQNLREVGELARELKAAEEQADGIRKRLHAKIRVTGDPALGPDEKAGPSAIARATEHHYTREYVGSLLNPKPKKRPPADAGTS